MEELCTKYGYTFLEFPLNVGGRYTAMTNVGLLPMAVAGIDIRALVQGAKDMQKRVHEESAENNIAYQYACLRNLYYQEAIAWRCFQALNRSSVFSINGGYSFLRRVKEKKTRGFSR